MDTGGNSLASDPTRPAVACTPGHQGCACDTSGASVACGTRAGQHGNYVTCAMGHSVCSAGQWGACVTDSLVTKSLGGAALGAGGLRALSVTAHCPGDASECNDPCDPDPFTVVTSNAGDVDAGGTATLDGGSISLTSCGLACQIALDCPSGSPTTLAGKVYDPAGNNPLPGAYVYVPVDPTGALPPLSTGPACDSCAAIGSIDAVTVAQTSADGSFSLPNVPSTDLAPNAAIPLVVQVGKWRREVMLASVPKCQTLAVDPNDSRLPRSSADGLGGHADIPKMAIATGSQDAVQCLLLKMGVDSSEFQLPGGPHRIDYYFGSGMDFSTPAPPESALVGGPGAADAGADGGGADAATDGGGGSSPALANYDIVLLPCGAVPAADPTHAYPIDDVYADNVSAYANAGGHLYTSHFGYTWLATPSNLDVQGRPTQANPTNPATGNVNPFYGVANWDLNKATYDPPVSATIDTTLASGQTFATWMNTIGAASASSQFSVVTARQDVDQVNAPATEWARHSSSPNEPFYFSFDTPLGASACGRVGFVDFHSENPAVTGDCRTSDDCGFTATCQPTTLGTCASTQCSRDADCQGYVCMAGPQTGQCIEDQCVDDTGCTSNVCDNGTCACVHDSDCISKVCSNGRCVPPTPNLCSLDKDCGSSEQCAGGSPGTCQKTCVTSADCIYTNSDHGELCQQGLCQGCNVDTDCASQVCNVGSQLRCSKMSDTFPLACRQGKLTPQEDALEFMLLDLTACTPPNPPASLPVPFPQGVSFTEDFAASCPAGTRPVWRELDWQALTPGDSSIVFSAQTAEDASDGGAPNYMPTPPVLLATQTASGVIAGPAGSDGGAPGLDAGSSAMDGGDAGLPVDAVLIDTGTTGVFNLATPPVISRKNLRLTVTMNRTSDRMSGPTLIQWQVKADCLPAE
jgi:hypothetical protein